MLSTKHPPRFDIDRLVAGELSGGEAAGLRQHLRECASCAAVRDSLLLESRALLARWPPAAFVASIESAYAARGPRRWRRPVLLLAPAAVAAAAAALITLALQPQQRGESRLMGGELAVQVLVERGGQSRPLEALQLSSGDRLSYQVIAPAGHHAFVAIVAVEAGRPLPLLPAPPRTAAIEVAAGAFVPGAVAVEAGGPRVRVLVFARAEPFTMDELLQLLEMSGHEDGLGVPGLVHSMTIDVPADSP